MNARTEEQDELAAVVRSVLDKHADSAAVRAAAESEQGYDESLWRALVDVGVTALPVPEDHDGLGASLVESAVVLEELGRSLAPTPYLGTTLATAALLLHDQPEPLARIVEGEPIGIVVDDLALDPPTVVAVRDGDVTVETAEPVGALDPTMRLGRVEEPTALSGPLRDVAWAMTSALQVGTMQRGLDMTVAYSKERVQFGRPIGSFQALKHRMADLLVLVESSRSVSWGATAAAAAYLAERNEDHAEQLARRAAAARSWCTDALAQVAAETVQLHGGIAITWEHDAQLVLKRAHALGQLLEPAHVARAELV